jgi:2-hydroxy-3-oxopropionate reductase
MSEIGFIGLGIMGTPMCRNLLKAGHKVVAYNRSTEPINRTFATNQTDRQS